jgi:Putative auto-transporter adhesin, head GIN domain
MRYLMILLLLLFFSCKNAKDRSCFKFSGKTITITRQVALLSRIIIFDNIDMTIYQSNRNEMEITGGEHLLNFISTKTNGDILEISNKNKCNFLRNEKDKIKINLYIPNFSRLTNEGFGNISIPEKFSTTKLRFDNLGYGDLDANVSLSDSLILSMSSGNKAVVRGNANTFYTYAIGQNTVNALELAQVKTGVVFAFTNNDIYMMVDSLFYIDQVGKGIVYYKGNPKIVSRTPSAKIVKLD